MCREGGTVPTTSRPPLKIESGQSESARCEEGRQLAESHNALVIPMSDGYAVSCSCGWTGSDHPTPKAAEREAADHEADQATMRGKRMQVGFFRLGDKDVLNRLGCAQV